MKIVTEGRLPPLRASFRVLPNGCGLFAVHFTLGRYAHYVSYVGGPVRLVARACKSFEVYDVETDAAVGSIDLEAETSGEDNFLTRGSVYSQRDKGTESFLFLSIEQHRVFDAMAITEVVVGGAES